MKTYPIIMALILFTVACAPADPCHYELIGDVDENCIFDLVDLALLSHAWLIDCQNTPGDPECFPLDIDGDGFDITTDCDDHDPNTNPAATEINDGIDNNCDGQIDEGCLPDGTACDDGDDCTYDDTYTGCVCSGIAYLCDDGPCTIGMCDGFGSCTNTITPGSCYIDGSCYSHGQYNPANPCEECNIAMDPSSWSSVSDGMICNDGFDCTVNDSCSGGTCLGMPWDCSSMDDQCNTGTCVEGQGCIPVPVPDGTSCDDFEDCTYNDTCSGGACAGIWDSVSCP